jgi:hypothetical protein
MADFRLSTFLDFGTTETSFYIVPPVGRPPTVFVRYDNRSGGEPILWEQRDAGDWTKTTGPELAARMRDSNRRQAQFRQGGGVTPDTGLDRIDSSGYVDAPTLRAGSVYRAWLTNDPLAHPAAPGTDLSGMATVLAAGRRGTVLGPGGVLPTPRLDSLDLEIAPAPAPMVYLAEIGCGRLQRNQPHGWRYFRDPHGRVIEGTPRRTGSLAFRGLTPGQTYTVVIRAMNTRGFWQELVREVTLIQRQVELTIDAVRIVNDADPSAEAQGCFRAEFFVGRWGDEELPEIVRAYRFPPTGTGPPWPARIGPEPVSRNEFGVYLEVFEDPEPFETDAYGRGHWAPDEFLTPVTDRPFALTTRRSAGAARAEARGRYSVRHLSPGPPPGPWQSLDMPETADDLRVDADYDGDGRVEEAAYRPGSGVWFIAPAGGGLVRERKLGEPGDFPAPADYDGDGKTDLAVWRPGKARWLVRPSSGGAVIERSTGEDGTPVPAEELDGLLLLARSLAGTAQWLSAAGRRCEAVQPARGAVGIMLGIAARLSPEQRYELVSLVGVHSRLLVPAEAVDAVERAAGVTERLAAEAPENCAHRYRNAWIRCVLAQRLEAAGRRSEAAAPARQAIAVFRALPSAATPDQVFDLILQIGIFSGYLPPAEAVEAVAEAVCIAHGLARSHPDELDYRHRHAWILCMHAQRLEAAGRRPDSTAAARAAIGILLELAPGAAPRQVFDLVLQIGIFSGYLPPAEAVEPVRRAVEAARALAKAGDFGHRYRHPWIQCVLAQRLEAAGHRAEAAGPARTAIEILLELAPEAEPRCAFDLVFQVGVFSGYLPPEEAVAPVEQAVALAQRLADAHPDDADYKARAGWIREVRTQRLAAKRGG